MSHHNDGPAGNAREGQAKGNRELDRFFSERAKRLTIVATTRTPSGKVIDWVPAGSQAPEGTIATPPPMPPEPTKGEARRPGRPPEGVPVETTAEAEVQVEHVEPGPEGTVPVVRQDLSHLPEGTSLSEGIARVRGKKAPPPVGPVSTKPRPATATGEGRAAQDPVADPNPYGYFHATTAENALCFGGETVLNVWHPGAENEGDHSVFQMGIQNRLDLPKLQSIEAGWEVSHDQYGDWDPHLFVYYTTNGYTKDDDNVGGYNQTVDGWQQASQTIFPAARLSPTSERGGTQRIAKIKIQLFEGNWWVQVLDEWIGYYPAKLFMGDQSVFTTLGDHGDWIGFWGEVYSADDDPNTTTTQMGSGSFGESGWGQAAYQRNLKVQSGRDGTVVDSAGSTSAEVSAWYDIVQTIPSETTWQSYFYAGGPGADIRWDPLGGQWPGDPAVASNADGRLEVFLRGNDTDLYHLWQTEPNNGWSAPWAGMGGQWHRDPVVARNADGRLEVFIIGDDTNLYHRWQLSPGGAWSEPWTPMGGQWHHQPVVATNADGRLEIFIIGDDTNLYHLWQTAPSNGWSAPWAPMGGQWHHQPVLGTNADGRLEIFIVGNDTDLYHLWQTAPSNGWSAPWAPMGGQWPADPSLARNADGRLEIFIHGNRPYLYDRWQTAPSNGWSNDWLAMRGSWHRPAVVGDNADGRLEIFIVGDDTNLYHAWQTAPSNGWALG